MKKNSLDKFVTFLSFLACILLYAFKLEAVANIFFFIWLLSCMYFSLKKVEIAVETLCIIGTHLMGFAPDKIYNLQIEKYEMLFLVMFTLYFVLARKKIDISNYRYLLLSIPMVLIASIVACVKLGQSIHTGIFLQTRVLILLCPLFCIPLCKGQEPQIQKKLKYFVKKFALIQSGICIVQYLVYQHFVFLNISLTDLRLGGLRVRFGAEIIAIAVIVTLSDLLNDKKITTKDIFLILIYLYELLFVSKTRMILIGTVVAALTEVVLSLSNKKKVQRSLIVVLLAFLGMNLFSNQISALTDLTTDEVSSGGGNYGVRLKEIAFYTDQVKYPLIGRGYISPNTPGGQYYDTMYGTSSDYYSLTDIGIFGLYTIYGILGIAWYILLIYYLLKNSKYCRDKAIYIGYAMCAISTCSTLLLLYYNPESLILLLLLKECDLKTNNAVS